MESVSMFAIKRNDITFAFGSVAVIISHLGPKPQLNAIVSVYCEGTVGVTPDKSVGGDAVIVETNGIWIPRVTWKAHTRVQFGSTKCTTTTVEGSTRQCWGWSSDGLVFFFWFRIDWFYLLGDALEGEG